MMSGIFIPKLSEHNKHGGLSVNTFDQAFAIFLADLRAIPGSPESFGSWSLTLWHHKIYFFQKKVQGASQGTVDALVDALEDEDKKHFNAIMAVRHSRTF